MRWGGSSSGCPVHRLQSEFAPLPKSDALGLNPNHFSHSFGVRIEFGVPQKASDEKSRVTVIEIQPHKTIGWMDQTPFEVVLVVGEEDRAIAVVEEWDDIGILDARSRYIAR